MVDALAVGTGDDGVSVVSQTQDGPSVHDVTIKISGGPANAYQGNATGGYSFLRVTKNGVPVTG